MIMQSALGDQTSPTRRATEPQAPSPWRARLAAAALLLFVVVGVWYSLVVPPFEAPDELFHYAFARHLAQGNPLPIQSPRVEAPWEQEGSQAPLYYWLVGRLTAPIDQDDFEALNVRNPRANIGDPLFPGNKNFMLHSAVARPLQDSNLALHVGRWFSLLLGVVTLLFSYLTARIVFPVSSWLPLVALLILATIPQFTFISAALNNDNLINAASAVVIFWLARLLSRAVRDEAPPAIWEWLVLGALLGVAALSKLQGLGLYLLSALAGLFLAWRLHDWRLPLRALLPVALPAIAIAGWWYWRNHTLYGDWSGVGNLLANNGRRDDPLTLAGFWREFRGLRYSFWGLFGWFNILLPQWIYAALDSVTVLALAGLGIGAGRRLRWATLASPRRAAILLVAVWALLSLALLLYWTIQATGSQGRLLFPGIGAFVILLVMGLDFWLRRLSPRFATFVWALLPALLASASIYALTVLLPTSYRAPAPVTVIPPTATPLDVVYGEAGQLRLLAIELPDRRYVAGEAAPVTLYLQAPAPVDNDYQLFIQFLDEHGEEVANLTSHPGWGRNPTTLWRPGAIYADSYPVQIAPTMANWAPLWARVYVGFVDPATETSGRFPIIARNAAGDEIAPFVSQVAISPRTTPTLEDATAIGAEFGAVIQLTAYRLEQRTAAAGGDEFSVTLQWDARGAPATDYTAFVQLRGEDGAVIAGYDQAPAGDRFPTRFWRSGDRVVNHVTLSLPDDAPPGRYTLWAGLYETASAGALRLPITQTGNHRTGDGEVALAEIDVAASPGR